MRMIQNAAALFAAAALSLSLCACSSPASTAKYNVGICQLIEFDAHDDATEGFIAALNEEMPGEVYFSKKQAANDISACSTIINQFLAEEVDLILANATPVLQIAVASTGETPILGTSVTEYSAALGLKETNGTLGANVSGTSDLAPLDKQAEMIKQWFPDAKKVGFLYCSAEANSKFQIDGIRPYLEKLGYECKDYAFTDSNNLASMTETAAANCDVIFVPTDNTIADNAPIIDNICRYEKVPVVGGDEAICRKCTVAALCVDYYELGVATGKMAAKILKGEANIAQLPIEYAPFNSVYNSELCAELNLTVPEGYTAIQR